MGTCAIHLGVTPVSLGIFCAHLKIWLSENFAQLMIDAMHNAGLGVILDWVPSRLSEDAHGWILGGDNVC
jgi:hypothetical protein